MENDSHKQQANISRILANLPPQAKMSLVPPVPMVPINQAIPYLSLAERYHSLYKFDDLDSSINVTLKCKNGEISFPKNVICAKSQKLAEIIYTKASDVIELPDIEISTAKLFFQFDLQNHETNTAIIDRLAELIPPCLKYKCMECLNNIKIILVKNPIQQSFDLNKKFKLEIWKNLIAGIIVKLESEILSIYTDIEIYIELLLFLFRNQHNTPELENCRYNFIQGLSKSSFNFLDLLKKIDFKLEGVSVSKWILWLIDTIDDKEIKLSLYEYCCYSDINIRLISNIDKDLLNTKRKEKQEKLDTIKKKFKKS